MTTLFEIGPFTSSLSPLDFISITVLLIVLVWLFKKKEKVPILIILGFLLVFLGASANLGWNSYWHYEQYKSYLSGTEKVRVIEGVITSIEKTNRSEWHLYVDEKKFYYSDRGGVGCQGEEGWLYNIIDEGDYIKLSYLPIYERENDIRCLVKLEKR